MALIGIKMQNHTFSINHQSVTILCLHMLEKITQAWIMFKDYVYMV